MSLDIAAIRSQFPILSRIVRLGIIQQGADHIPHYHWIVVVLRGSVDKNPPAPF